MTPSSSRPNLVFLFADQLRYHACGFAGDPCAVTPNVDRLAAQSANCINAFSNTPVCAAYRASLFTGKHQSSHGMVINELRLNFMDPRSIDILTQHMREFLLLDGKGPNLPPGIPTG